MRVNEFILVTDSADNDNGNNPETTTATISATPAAIAKFVGTGFSVGTLRDGKADIEEADTSYGNYNIWNSQSPMYNSELTFTGSVSALPEPDNADTNFPLINADVIMLVKVK